MTHDELLAKIENYTDYAPVDYGQVDLINALRAVVELHKPRTVDGVDIPMCDYCDWNSYPCGSIQAIEKELK